VNLRHFNTGELEYMEWVFTSTTVASIALWMALIRAMQEQLPGDAGVESTWMYLRRVAEVNTQFMSARNIIHVLTSERESSKVFTI